MEIFLPRVEDGDLQFSVLKRSKLNDEGRLIGIDNNNTILDTRLYEVYYLGVTTEEMTGNIISEIFSHRYTGKEIFSYFFMK